MDSKKLTPAQIDQLYTFTKQHYVEYYDLQTELVDHLANAIELEWETNPSLSFETLLNKEFKKFGVFGFMDVVEEKQKAMNKIYNKLVWGHFKTFFKLPQIIGTFLSIFLLFQLMKSFAISHDIATVIAFLLLISFWVGLIRMNRKRKKTAKANGKRWLLNEIIYGYSSLAGMSYLPIQIFLNFENNSSQMMLFFMSVFIVSIIIIEYIIFFIIPSKAQEYLEKTYPEFKISNQ
jgi:hypothetical protein